MAIPVDRTGDWDLLDWSAPGAISNGVTGLQAQIGSAASISDPSKVETATYWTKLWSDNAAVTDYVLLVNVPKEFTFEFSGILEPPTDAFRSSDFIMAIGAQDRGGEAGLLFLSKGQSQVYLQTPPNGSTLSLGDVATAMRDGQEVTFRLVVNGTTGIMNVYAAVTSSIPVTGQVHRGTVVAPNSTVAMDYISIYLKGTSDNPSTVTLTSMGLSSQLLHPVQLPVARVEAPSLVAAGDRVVLDGSASTDASGLPLTYEWSVISQPPTADVVLSSYTQETAVFAPSVSGLYSFGLVVSNGTLSSLQAVSEIQVSGTAVLTGYTPDASYLWSYLSDVWPMVKQRDQVTTFWSAFIQQVSAMLMDTLQAADERSISTFPERLIKRWVPFKLRDTISATMQYAPYGSYSIKPHPYVDHFVYTDKFYFVEPSVPVVVGQKLAWEGGVYTVLSVASDGLCTINAPALPVLTLVASGNGAYGVDDFDDEAYTQHDGMTKTVRVDGGDAFPLLTGWPYLDLDGSIYDVEEVVSASEITLKVAALPVARAHTPYYDGTAATRVLFTAKTEGPEGNNCSILLQETQVLTLTPGATSTGVTVFAPGGVDFVDIGVQEGDIVSLIQTAPVDYGFARVIDVQAGKLELATDCGVAGTAWIEIYSQPGRVTKVDDRTIVLNVARYTLTYADVLDVFTNESSPWYSPEADKIFDMYVQPGMEDFFFPYEGVYTLKGGTRSEFLPWKVYVPAGNQTVYLGSVVTLDAPVDLELSPLDLLEVEVDGDTQQCLLRGSSDTELVADVAEDYSAYTPVSVVRRTSMPFSEDLVAVPYLQSRMVIPAAVVGTDSDPRFKEGKDFLVSSGVVSFITPLELGTYPDRLWAEVAIYDNADTLDGNFGVLVGLPRESAELGGFNLSYLSAVRGLMFVLFRGPTMSNIRIGGQVFCNLPFAEYEGVVDDISPDFDTVNGLGRILMRMPGEVVKVYYYPTRLGLATNDSTGLPIAVGDTLHRFHPLCGGVTVSDYVSDPDWFHGITQEVQKFHVFRVSVDSEVVNANAIRLLSDFVKTLKPAHTDVVFSVVRAVSDEHEFEESLTANVRLLVRDNRYTCEDEDPPFESGYTQSVDDVDGASNMHSGRNEPVNRYDSSLGSIPHRWAKFYGVGSVSGTNLYDPVGLFQTNGVVPGDLAFMWDGSTSCYAPVTAVTDSTVTFASAPVLQGPVSYDVGRKVLGPDSVVEAWLQQVHSTLLGVTPRQMFDHVCERDGRQKDHWDRILKYGPECMPQIRVGTYIPAGGTYPHVRLSSTATLAGSTLTDTSQLFRDVDGNYTTDVRVGCYAYVDPDGAKDYLEITFVGPHTLVLADVPTAAPGDVSYRVLPKLAGPEDLVSYLLEYEIGDGGFPRWDTIHQFDRLVRYAGSRKDPDDPALQADAKSIAGRLRGPRQVREFLLNSVPNFDGGFFTWFDVKLIDQQDGNDSHPYIDTDPVGPGTDTLLDAKEPHWRPDLNNADVVQDVMACTVKSLGGGTPTTLSKYREPEPFEVT